MLRYRVVTEFGHLGLEAPDVKEAEKFWTKHFNLKVSDRIGANAVLMRFDPVHHKLAVFADQTSLQADFVRHEALHYRMEVKRLHPWSVAAGWGS